MSGIDYVTWFFLEYAEPIEKMIKILALVTVLCVCGITANWFLDHCIDWHTEHDVDVPVIVNGSNATTTPIPTSEPIEEIRHREFKPYGTFYQYPGSKQYNTTVWVDREREIVYLEDPGQVKQVYNPDRAGHAIENQYYTVYTQYGIEHQGYYDPARNVIYTIIRDDIFAE